MIPMKSIVFAALMLLAAPVFAQDAAVAAAPDVPEIAPASAAKGDCEKCKQGGKMARGDMEGMQHGAMGGMGCCGGKMAHGGGMGGKSCCGGMQHGGAGDTAALERRINELEKRLDLMQQLLQQLRKTH